jgi:hypothetical protein
MRIANPSRHRLTGWRHHILDRDQLFLDQSRASLATTPRQTGSVAVALALRDADHETIPDGAGRGQHIRMDTCDDGDDAARRREQQISLVK